MIFDVLFDVASAGADIFRASRKTDRQIDQTLAGKGKQKTRANPYDYPGDYQGVPQLSYAPVDDNHPDPGEVVWAWVPYEEDYSQGKDRPVLIVGRDKQWLLGLMLTSKDHDREAAEEAAKGRYWVDIGAGEWDQARRASEARVNRILRLSTEHIRRPHGYKISPTAFERVAAGIRAHNG
ncbi:MAG: type II toxin-antitoxin system PemK/MazF family toxin [Propionibacteriaceae bacterium]|jgi:hypothetical protein|nr:type II toxin-antitoxin system PemK/MazF family toxin [Propionibacteriaceae bacterium]